MARQYSNRSGPGQRAKTVDKPTSNVATRPTRTTKRERQQSPTGPWNQVGSSQKECHSQDPYLPIRKYESSLIVHYQSHMNPKIIAITSLLIGIAAGMTVGALVLGPLIVKPSGSSKCQPETIVLANMHSYNGFWVSNVQNAGPGTITLSSYGVSGLPYAGHPSYIYNSTTYNVPTANPAIASGVTVGVNAYMGAGWTYGSTTTITVITSCGNKWSAQIGY